MPKNFHAQNYQNAYDILYGKWLSISPTDHQSEDEEECCLPTDNLSPDQAIIKQESFTSLSEEAKEIIHVVLFAPAEIIDLIATPKTKKITLRGIKKYFTKKWKSDFITEITIKEITTWISKL